MKQLEPTLIVDDAGVVVEVNAAVLALIARDAPSLIGVPLALIVIGASTMDDTGLERADAVVKRGGIDLAVHVWRRRLGPNRTAVTLRDADEWLNAQSTLALVVTGVEQGVDAFEITDENGNIEYANKAHTLAVGRSLFDVMGEPMTRFIEPDDAARVDAALRSGTSWRGEIACRRPDGEQRHHDLTLTPVTDALTGTRRFVAIRRDVTDRVVAEKKVEALRERLIVADRLAVLGQLAASVGHDLNNPATFILTNLRLALEDLDAWPGADSSNAARVVALKEMLTDALDGTERVIALVRGMRSLGVRAAPRSERVPLADIAAEAIRLTRSQTAACATVVEKLAVPAVVLADRLRLGQVAVNLIVNATQAIASGAPAGSRAPEPARAPGADMPESNVITVETREVDGFAELSVSDTGVGIAAGDLERVFEAWFTTKNRDEGTGLGLAVCRQIVAELGGTLVARRGAERGSVFTLRLALAPPT